MASPVLTICSSRPASAPGVTAWCGTPSMTRLPARVHAWSTSTEQMASAGRATSLSEGRLVVRRGPVPDGQSMIFGGRSRRLIQRSSRGALTPKRQAASAAYEANEYGVPGMEPAVKASWRAFYRTIKITYGMTPEQYRALYLAQQGRCYICRTAKGIHPDDPKGRGGRRLGVDHNHAIGHGRADAVRALLCTGGDRTCNRIIGWLNAPGLLRAHEVLTQAPAQAVFRIMAEEGAEPDELLGMLTRP